MRQRPVTSAPLFSSRNWAGKTILWEKLNDPSSILGTHVVGREKLLLQVVL